MSPEPGKWGVSPILGHDFIWDVLTNNESPVVLHFLGPEGVGRMKFAREWHWKINGSSSSADYLAYRDPKVDQIEDLRFFADMPPNYLHRTVAIEFTKMPHPGVVARLCALLDEPLQTKFVLVSTFELPEPLATRASTYVFGGLDAGTVADILVNRGVPPENAKKYAAQSEGSIARALEIRNGDKPKQLAMTLVNAIADRSTRPLNKVHANWTAESKNFLRIWLRESITGVWKVFDPEDDKALSRMEKLALLRATSQGTTGKNAVRRAAEDIIRGGTGA